MEPKLIKTESEYEAALARIDALISASPDTPEGDELELWVHLIEVYEDEHFPIPLPDPLEAIRFRMTQQGLKQADLIPYIGNRSKVSEVLNGKRALSLAMIHRLHVGLGIPAEVLLGKPGSSLSADASGIDWSVYPLAEMVKRGWFGDAVQSRRDLLDRAEELLLPFLMPKGKPLLQNAYLRHTVRDGKKVDKHALATWKARVSTLAREQRTDRFNAEVIDQQFISEVARLSPLDNGPLVARNYLGKAGVRMIIEPQMHRTYLDGAAIQNKGESPFIALTLRYDRIDSFWFTLCHELAHVVLHFREDEDIYFLDDLDSNDVTDKEKEADDLARNAIIPEFHWNSFCRKGFPSKQDVRTFAASLRLDPAIIAGRYRRENNDYRIFSDLIGTGKVKRLFKI